MKIRILSDLHLEFHDDDGRALLRSLEPRADDVLVVAGDLCTGRMLPGVVRRLCETVAHVVYVTGNHEYYGSSPDEVHGILAGLASDLPGFHWLHETEAVIGGVRFGGTTLWFPDGPLNERYAPILNDFARIRGFRPWVYEANAGAVDFLRRRAPALDVVVTHHVPAPRSLGLFLAWSPLRRFLLCDVRDVIRGARPGLWVHGHAHSASDYRIGATRVVCNPAGYPREKVRFDPGKTVQVHGDG